MSKTASMTEQHLTTFQQLHDVVYGEHDFERLDEFLAPDVVLHQSGRPAISGIDGITEYFEGMTAAFSETAIDFAETVADDDVVMGRFAMTALNDGPFTMGQHATLEPTDLELTWDGVVSARFEDDLIDEITVLTDRAQMYEQLGVQPAA